MSVEGRAQRTIQRAWAVPGSSHDTLIGVLKKVLPVLTLALAAMLTLAPFTHQSEVSFVLDKKKVDMAAERLKVTEALYRGEDSRGRPFSLRAGSALQKSSREPIVQLNDLEARLQMESGSALVTAQKGAYDLNKEKVTVDGPIRFESENGYRLITRDVDIQLNSRTLHSRGPVEGRMPTGTFSADHLSADLEKRTVSLDGRATLRIVQFGRKGR
ncbi:MAG: LPS export ABC transporter periplasmic protein LptC [Novosphingobium sp.]|nr:LPS export ABC transporter periplasmic protein LptC [Novosphingobium sp.]